MIASWNLILGTAERMNSKIWTFRQAIKNFTTTIKYLLLFNTFQEKKICKIPFICTCWFIFNFISHYSALNDHFFFCSIQKNSQEKGLKGRNTLPTLTKQWLYSQTDLLPLHKKSLSLSPLFFLRLRTKLHVISSIRTKRVSVTLKIGI